MTDFLSTGLSGLLAFRRALDVTGHNIANVGTEGYTRQRVDFATRPANPFGNGWIGTGVAVTTIRRTFDDFLASQSRASSSSLERLEVFASMAGRVDELFADSQTGISASLQKFVNAVQGVSAAPSSLAARQVLLGEARALADRFRYFDSRLRELDREVNQRVQSEAAEITTLARGIARLNAEVSTNLARTGQPPNDLMDQRDRLLDQLAQRIDVQVVPQDSGVVNVFVGSGQPLVLNSDASTLSASPDPFDSERLVLSLASTSGSVDVTANLTGGSLGGTLDFRRETLDPARNALGRIAVAAAEVVNAQHRAGIDLSGALGQDLFAVGGVRVLDEQGNAGSASLAVTRSGAGALTAADYQLERTAGGWSLRRLDTGATVALTGTGTAVDPLRGDGLAIVVSGVAQTGDRFRIQPTRDAANGFALLVNDPARVAAAAPIRTSAATANTGNGAISAGEVLDASNAQLRNTVVIEFLTANTYSINGAGSFAYTNGGNIDVNGWRVQITGAPAVGDRFTVSDNSTGSGDNRNALALAQAITRPVLDGGSTSIGSAVARFVGDVGVVTRQAQLNLEAQQLVHEQAVEERQSVSGVNLDEEAANLLRFQQAYQASAQLIQVANTLFDTLLAATRR
jgi:flagellar hook-associated protein 1 FlgK